MKKGIFVALAALALAIVAVPDAHGDGERDLHMTVFGGNVVSSDTDGIPTPIDGGAIHATQSGKTKGSGSPSLFSSAALAAVDFNNLPAPGCPAAMPLGSDIDATLVFIYDDGSLLSIATELGSFYCSDGTNFTVSFVGSVVGGNGRFEGATGSWVGTTQTFPGGRFIGEISVDLD